MTVYPRLVVGDCIRGSLPPFAITARMGKLEKTALKNQIWTLLEMRKAQAVYVQ